MHAPVLVNTLGHCAGAVVFGILLYLLFVNWRRDRHPGGGLACTAAALALLWNAGSLVAMSTAPGNVLSDMVLAGSFSVLSVLPAVLLHISLGFRRPSLAVAGYVVSVLAVALHIADLMTDAPRFHFAAILLVAIGFGVLAAIALGLEIAGVEQPGSGRRLAGAMVLLGLAISFAHFRSEHQSAGWAGEALLHHSALPLALFVLLQDYRFLLLDTFIRFIANAILATATVSAALLLYFGAHPRDPFASGILFAGLCLLISVFAAGRQWLQRALTRVVFLRGGSDSALAQIRAEADRASGESEFLESAMDLTAGVFSAGMAALVPPADPGFRQIYETIPVADPSRFGLPAWTQAASCLRFSRGDCALICLGSRAGGRRYLSEDLALLNRIAAAISERVERMRNSEMEALVAKAELRALQAQINPHFFFNALNTLYGTIPREAAAARRLVLNLSDLFRVSFASERPLLRIEEEIRIVRAYLEIEQLRLGSRLCAQIEVDEKALHADVPALSIQPLVENAVKHGVAGRPGFGFVRLRIQTNDNSVRVEVTNSGAFQPRRTNHSGTGVGLENVRRRLALCYGDVGELQIDANESATTVSFSVPLPAVTGRTIIERTVTDQTSA